MTTQTREEITLTRTAAPPASPAERQADGRRPGRQRFSSQSTAGEVVLGYLAAQSAQLSLLDLAVRRDKPDAVHQMRVTVRRLRTALQAFTPVLPKRDTAHLRAELKWLSGLLGDARDAEVLTDRLRGGLAAVPEELLLGPAQARISVHFAPVEAEARRDLLTALDSSRYRELRTELGALLDRPPLTREAADPAARVLPRSVARAYRRTSRRMRAASRMPAGQAHDAALHEARKAAKRARYAAEVVAPALDKKHGKQARRFAKRVKKVQSVLGDHQDAVIAMAAARDLGVHAHLAGENAFSFGLLQARNHQQALACQREAHRAWRGARRAARAWPPKS
jgi:CHAD domain-containing protein